MDLEQELVIFCNQPRNYGEILKQFSNYPPAVVTTALSKLQAVNLLKANILWEKC